MMINKEKIDRQNLEYLSKLLGNEKVRIFEQLMRESVENLTHYTCEEFESYLEVFYYLENMNSYGDNRWWLSEEATILAYYQSINSMQLIHIQKYLWALEKLLKRTVKVSEFGFGKERLKEEVRIAFENS